MTVIDLPFIPRRPAVERPWMKRAKRIGSPTAQWIVAAVILYSTWKWLVAPHESRLFVVSPDAVISQIRAWLADGTARAATWVTFKEAGTGYFIGSFIGVTLALLTGLLPSIFAKCVEPVVTAIYASPKFVIVPLLFVWLGAGFYPRVVLISLAVFAFVFISTATGIKTVDPDQARMLQMLGANRKQMATTLVLPHTTSYIVTGMTNAAAHAVTIAIGTEILFGTTAGLGGIMYTESELFDAKQVLASLVIATIVASVTIQLVMGIGRWLTRPGGRYAKY